MGTGSVEERVKVPGRVSLYLFFQFVLAWEPLRFWTFLLGPNSCCCLEQKPCDGCAVVSQGLGYVVL